MSKYGILALTREQWAALDPANRYRARLRCADGREMCGMYRPDEPTAKADLDELLGGYQEMRQRCPYLAEVTSADIDDRNASEEA